MAAEPIQATSPRAGSPKAESTLGARVARNSKWNILAWLCLMALGFISAPIMVRQLGAEFYGLMALLTSIIVPLGLMDMGIGEATIKYVAESLGRADMKEAELHLRVTFFFNVVMGVLGAGVIILLAPLLVRRVFNIAEANVPLAQACLFSLGGIWCATQVRQTFIGAITALQEYKVVSIGTFLTQAAHTVTGLAVLLSGGGLLGMIRAQAFMAAISVAGWWLLARHRLPGVKLLPGYQHAVLRKTLSFGLWQMGNNLGGIMVHQAQRWLLGTFAPVAAVGFLNIGTQLVTMIYSAAYRIGQVMFPTVSQMQGEGREGEAVKMIVQTSWMMTTAAIAGYVAMAVLAQDFLRLWVGPAVASQTTMVLQILALGFSMSCLFAIPNFYLLGTGRSRWLAIGAAAQGTISLCAGIMFIPRWGVVGAAIALAGGMIVVYGLTLVVIWRRLFRPHVAGPQYFSATFGAWATGLALAFSLSVVRAHLSLHLAWWSLALAGGGCFCLAWVLAMAVDALLPGGRHRRLTLLELVGNAVPGFFRLRQRVLPVRS